MKKLAIKGHPTRSKEVIEILKMLGGNDDGSWWGNDMDSAYFINDRTQKIDVCTVETDIDMEYEYEYAYSIGELIEMLPKKICIDETLYSRIIDKNDVCYYSWELETYALLICDVQEELIDNLYDMLVQLKEEGVI